MRRWRLNSGEFGTHAQLWMQSCPDTGNGNVCEACPCVDPAVVATAGAGAARRRRTPDSLTVAPELHSCPRFSACAAA